MTEREPRDTSTTEPSDIELAGTISGMLVEGGSAPSDFEHRRIFASVRARLFGVGERMSIGRFRVEGQLGVGGMGEVFLCHDDALRRPIAVKLVLGRGSASEHARLRREAQAQARLSHANVVHVYEIGEHEGRTFVAMEYVAGQTLAARLSDRPSRAEIVATFLAAGRGLAAAHRAGIVHRDFKPENVLIGRDGVAKVADFGLALAGEPALADAPTALARHAGANVTSSVGGTLRYMPLEQLRGDEVGPASDQFAFCVSLYEALWGRSPFPTPPRERLAALERDEPLAPTNASSLWSVVRVGLRADPHQRWPDMDSLLDALERAAGRPRRLARALVGAAALGLVVVGLLFVGRPADPCDAVAQELAATWNEDQRARFEQHAASLGVEPTRTSRVADALDRWSNAWLVARERTCRAPPSRLHDECLERQRQHFEALVEPLRVADATTLDRAQDAVDRLPEPTAGCSGAGVEPPPPMLAGSVRALRLDIARAHQLRLLGRLAEAKTLAEQADAQARELGFGPVEAEARAELAKLFDELGDHHRAAVLYTEALELAAIHGDDRLTAELATERAELALVHERPPGVDDRLVTELLDHWLDSANRAHLRASRARLVHDPWARARLAWMRGRVAQLRGDDHGAVRAFAAAVVIAALHRSARFDLHDYLASLAGVVESREHARGLHHAALGVAELRFGPHHPRTNKRRSALLISEADLALRRSPLDPSERARAESLARRVASSDPGERGTVSQLLATIAGMRGQPELALVHAGEGLAYLEHAGRHRESLDLRREAGNQLLNLGRLDAAEAEFTYLLTHAEGETAARAHESLAELALRRGEFEQADLLLSTLDTARLPDLDLYMRLRAIVDLRLARRAACLAPVASPADPSGSPDLWIDWYDQLGLTDAERCALGSFEANREESKNRENSIHTR